MGFWGLCWFPLLVLSLRPCRVPWASIQSCLPYCSFCSCMWFSPGCTQTHLPEALFPESVCACARAPHPWEPSHAMGAALEKTEKKQVEFLTLPWHVPPSPLACSSLRISRCDLDSAPQEARSASTESLLVFLMKPFALVPPLLSFLLTFGIEPCPG